MQCFSELFGILVRVLLLIGFLQICKEVEYIFEVFAFTSANKENVVDKIHPDSRQTINILIRPRSHYCIALSVNQSENH